MTKPYGYVRADGEGIFIYGEDKFQKIKDVVEFIPIYTTPPQRKPLTDKQLNIIGSRWHLNLLGADEKAELFAFARAIEAAHGIKE